MGFVAASRHPPASPIEKTYDTRKAVLIRAAPRPVLSKACDDEKYTPSPRHCRPHVSIKVLRFFLFFKKIIN